MAGDFLLGQKESPGTGLDYYRHLMGMDLAASLELEPVVGF